MFLLDTNVVSEFRRPHRTNPKVAVWADSTSPSNMFLSSITILELELGAGLLERRDPKQGRLILDWINNRVLTAFDERILSVDTTVARAMRAASCPRSKAIQRLADCCDGVGPPPDRGDPKSRRFRANGRTGAEPVGIDY